MNTEKKSQVRSIARATTILRCIMNNIHSVKDIAARCELSMATVHRILKTLEEAEFVFQDPLERRYYLGPVFLQLSLGQTDVHKHLLAHSYGEIYRISELFNEFTAFDIEIGLQVITLLSFPSKLNYSVNRVHRIPFLGSESIVLLAQHNDSEIETILNSINYKGDSSGIFNKTSMEERVNKAKRDGYYVCTELTEGVMSISVPVLGYICPLVLSVVGQEMRLNSIASQIISEMKKSADVISDNISKQNENIA